MCQWFIDQLSQINIPTVLSSVLGSWFLRELIDLFKHRNLQKQKAKYDVELEQTKTRYQQEIQASYLQTQLKATALFKIYPELHWAFKEVEAAVYQYKALGGKHALDVWIKLNSKLAEHSIFLDDSLRSSCIEAKDTVGRVFSDYLSYEQLTDVEKKSVEENVSCKIDIITDLMRNHLLEEGILLRSIKPTSSLKTKDT